MVSTMIRRRTPTRTRRVTGAPRIPYNAIRESQEERWRTPPYGWPGSNLEWAVMWYLTEHGVGPARRKLRVNIDFFWQRAAPAPGLFLSRAFTRADFALPGWPGGRRGLILDPLYPFTHKSIKHDLDKRRILANQGWRLIFLDGGPLIIRPHNLIEMALRGQDLSRRGSVR